VIAQFIFPFLFFFPSISNILDGKNALIFEISIFSDTKVNLVGTLGRSKLKIPSNLKKLLGKQKKVVIFMKN